MTLFCCTLVAIAAMSAFTPVEIGAQQSQPINVAPAASSSNTASPVELAPVKDPATREQIEQYLEATGALDAYKLRWIAAVDKSRGLGEPYWPESFWVDLKTEMAKEDLMPMFVMFYQHIVSRQTMQEALDAYAKLGAEKFLRSEECGKIAQAVVADQDDEDRLTRVNTNAVIHKVYAIYKPQIKAARARYLAEHPDWKD
jgi:hypothetical protein